jgi:hypothetical protein
LIPELKPNSPQGYRRRLDGHNHLPKVILGVKFTEGIEALTSQAQATAADSARHQNLAIAPTHEFTEIGIIE